MKYPDYIKDGGTIGLVAPSFGCSFEPYKSCLDSAIECFEGMGSKLVEGPNC